MKIFAPLTAFLLSGILLQGKAQAVESFPASYQRAIDYILMSFTKDFDKLAKKTPSTMLVSIYTSEELSRDGKEYFHKGLMSLSENSRKFKIKTCHACMTPRAEVEAGNVYLRKGLTHLTYAKKMASLYDVNTYLQISLTISEKYINMRTSMHKVEDSTSIWSKNYKAHIFTQQDDASIISLTGGALLEKDASAIGALLTITELIKSGTVGATFLFVEKTPVRPQYIGLGPRMEFLLLDSYDTDEWGSVLGTLSLGVALKGLQNDLFVLTGFKVDMGTFTHLNFQYLYGKPLSSDNPSSSTVLTSTEGAYVGFGFNF